MKNSLDDYFVDVVKKEMRIDFNNENLSDVVESLIDFAKDHETK
ncbi:hypothetical protein JRD95_00989 [Rickettsia parkeri]|nr:hypothetical protein [Rickettsia parkeri]QWB86928.1 hypothetical protein JRD95_00989 [Rickettsia parkeri]